MRRLLGRVAQPAVPLLAMVAAFFHREVFEGRVFSPADQLYSYPPWNAIKPAWYHAPSNLLRSDETFIGLPHKVTIAADLRRFGITLWQHHTLAGSPNSFSLHLLGGFAYPPLVGFVFLDPAIANTMLYLSLPLFGAVAMYLLLGQVARTSWARLFGATSYAFSGYMVGWLSAFALPVIYACLPLALYLLARWMRERRPLLGVGYALVLSVTLFMGYPPANIVVFTLLAVFALSWWASYGRAGAEALPGAAWYTLLGLLGGAAAALPTFVQLTHFASTTYRGVLPPIPVQALVTYIFPNVFGNPTVTGWRGPDGNYSEYVAYAGGITVVLAVAGLAIAAARRRRDPFVIGAVAICALSALMTYGAWPLSILAGLPPFNNISPSRWQMGIDLSLAMLAAHGLDALAGRTLPASGRWAVAVGLGTACGLALGMVVAGPALLFGGGSFVAGDSTLRVALFGVGAVLLLLLVVPIRRLGLVASPLLVVLLFVDMFTFGAGFNPAIGRQDFYPRTPVIDFLASAAGGHRVLPIKGGGFGDVLGVYGLDTITGYDHFRDDRYVNLLGPLVSGDEVAFWRRSGYLMLGDRVDLSSPVLDLLDVKFVYYPAGEFVPPKPLHWSRVYSGPDGTVLENLNDVAAQALVTDAGAISAINHDELSPDRDHLTVQGPGHLVFDRPYSEDWVVSINGRTAHTGTYRDFFLTVPLEAGANDVTLRYQPAAYVYGLALSIAGLVLMIGALASGPIVAAWRRRRARRGGFGPQSNQPKTSTTRSTAPARL